MGEKSLSLQDLIRRRQASGFVGRQGELGLFAENLRLPEDDLRRKFLFSVRGDAGVGKTFLTHQLIRVAREHGYATAYVDESVFDIPAAMDAIAADLARQGRPCKDYTKRSETYRTHRQALDADPSAPEGLSSTLTRSAVRIGLRAAEEVPLVGAVAKEVNADAVAGHVDRMRAFLSHKLKNYRDVRLMLAPADELTPALADNLRAIASRQPVALFFDTYERTGAFLEPWLLDLLAGRYGDLPPNLVLTIAGQHALNVNAWGSYLSVRADLALDVFTDAEARALLAAHGVTDQRIVDVILGLTGRLPVLVATLADARPHNVDEVSDPSDNAVERFLKWEKDESHKEAALRGALARRLDRDTYAVATGSASVTEDFAWVRALPFVSEHADGYRYHDVVRDTMLRVLRRRSPTDWLQRHQALADHYAAARDALTLTGRPAWKDERWQASALEEHYHLLCANPVAARPAALAALVDTIDQHPQSVPRWILMIRQAGRDASATGLRDDGERLAVWTTDVGAGRLGVLTTLTTEPALDDQHRAIAYAERAAIHQERRQHEDALADLTRAIELDPRYQWAYGERGQTYRLMGRFAEAVADLTRAIELDPQYDWALGERGRTYREMGQLPDAVADLTRAIELDPRYQWAYGERGQTYRVMGRFAEAVADLTRAIELDPDYDWAFAERGQTYRVMGRFAEAVADLTRAIELDPEYSWAYGERGLTCRGMGRFDDALADLTRAIELDPEYVWAFEQRGRTYRVMGRFAEALADFTRAIELRPQNRWAFAERGQSHRLMGRLDDAVADLNRAIELDPEYGWAFGERGQVYRLAGRFEDAAADLMRAIELAPADGWSYYQIGLVKLAQGHTGAAQEYISMAIDADRSVPLGFPQDGWRALNLIVYLVAAGDRLEAVRHARDTIGQPLHADDIHAAIGDLADVQAQFGADVIDVVDLLRSRFACA